MCPQTHVHNLATTYMLAYYIMCQHTLDTHTHTHPLTPIHTHAHTHTHTHTPMHTHTHTYTHPHPYPCTHAHTPTHSHPHPTHPLTHLSRTLFLLKHPSDDSADFNALLEQLNISALTAVDVKIEILQTVLGVFQLDPGKKAVFREVCGFHYLHSVLASLIGSLEPRRSTPWIGGEWAGPCKHHMGNM